MKNHLILLLGLFVCAIASSNAQTRLQTRVEVSASNVLLVDFEPPTTHIVIGVGLPREAGEPVTFGSTFPIWLNYSMNRLNTGGAGGNLMVSINKGLSFGRLYVGASPAQGSGAGNFGVPVGEVELSSAPTVFIRDIGRSYTGDGIGNGHMITYRLELNSGVDLMAVPNTSRTVIFTIYN
jgi:hypothetical protein